MGNACIRAYGDSLIKVILAGKVTRVSHKPCKYNIQIPRLYSTSQRKAPSLIGIHSTVHTFIPARQDCEKDQRFLAVCMQHTDATLYLQSVRTV
jgi:hypothetical protein